MRSGVTILLLVGAIAVTACNRGVQKAERAKRIGPVEFQKKLHEHPKALLIDIRTEEELSTGYIENAVHIDYYSSSFGEKLRSYSKEDTIFLYCSKGGRSRMAVDTLLNSGFYHIFELKGGFDAWTAKELPVVKN